jgi:uncharacterized protein (TIGR03437 family)
VIDRDGVRVFFNRKPATEIQYLGLAPTAVGLYQINVRIQADDPSLTGTVNVEIETRNARSALSTIEIGGFDK